MLQNTVIVITAGGTELVSKIVCGKVIACVRVGKGEMQR